MPFFFFHTTSPSLSIRQRSFLCIRSEYQALNLTATHIPVCKSAAAKKHLCGFKLSFAPGQEGHKGSNHGSSFIPWKEQINLHLKNIPASSPVFTIYDTPAHRKAKQDKMLHKRLKKEVVLCSELQVWTYKGSHQLPFPDQRDAESNQPTRSHAQNLDLDTYKHQASTLVCEIMLHTCTNKHAFPHSS